MALQAFVWHFAEMSQTDVDLTGFKVQARDDKIGTVDQTMREGAFGYLIVNMGSWIFGRQVMLPGGVVRLIDLEREMVFVDRTKEEIMNAPDFDEARASDADYHAELGAYYGAGDHAE